MYAYKHCICYIRKVYKVYKSDIKILNRDIKISKAITFRKKAVHFALKGNSLLLI